MNVHVNLLHDDERRYQGLVSRKFIVLISLGLGVGLLVMVGGLLVSNFLGTRQEWNLLQERWRETEPRYKKYLVQDKERSRVKAMVGELNGCNHGRLGMHDFMLDLQRAVATYPIRFSRVSISAEASLVQAPVPKAPPLDVSVTNAPPVKPPPPIPAHRWHVTMTGRVFGERGHLDAVAFTEQLKRQSRLAELWESVRLQNLSPVAGSENRGQQIFTIEGVTKLRKCE